MGRRSIITFVATLAVIAGSIAASIAVAGCSRSDEDRIGDRVAALIDALNDHDHAAAAKLYAGGDLPAISSSGDSSIIYRMIHIPGGSDFKAGDVMAVVAGDEARATFPLAGNVRHGDSLAGTMNLRLRMELERDGEEWMFVPGSEVTE